MNEKFIELTEILWPEKGSTEFKYRTITVSVDKIKYFGGCELKLSAPLEIACKIFRGEIPEQYYREVGKKICTTIYFTDDTEVNVKETSQEISKILEMPSDRDEIKLIADEYQKPVCSEDDKYLLDETIKHLETLIRITKKQGSAYSDEIQYYQRDIDCLKSLKDRVQPQSRWEPSNEQMEALNDINITGCISYAGQGQELISLYNELKRLREE